jgi:hypothetical protein
MKYPKSMCEKARQGDKESIALILLDAPEMPMDMKMKPEEYAMKMVDDSYSMKDDDEFEPHMMYDKDSDKSEMAETKEEHTMLDEKGYVHADKMPVAKLFMDMGLPEKLIQKISERVIEAMESGKI